MLFAKSNPIEVFHLHNDDNLVVIKVGTNMEKYAKNYCQTSIIITFTT
jgi:hypothetical protein